MVPAAKTMPLAFSVVAGVVIFVLEHLNPLAAQRCGQLFGAKVPKNDVP
jgi:hypothetical protein